MALLNPFLSAHDLLWLYFEVLEVTGNPTVDALEGGGFYSPEGFPFPNM
jgi:hypothetical protein